jgi:hypothetical protein
MVHQYKYYVFGHNPLSCLYLKTVHMSLLDHPICQPSLDISPVWTPLITAESRNYNSVKCSLSGKIYFSCVGTIRSIASLQ